MIEWGEGGGSFLEGSHEAVPVMGHRLRQFHTASPPGPPRPENVMRSSPAPRWMACGQVAEAAVVPDRGRYGDLDAAGGDLAACPLQFFDDVAPAGHFPLIDPACGGFLHPPDERQAGDGGGGAGPEVCETRRVWKAPGGFRFYSM